MGWSRISEHVRICDDCNSEFFSRFNDGLLVIAVLPWADFDLDCGHRVNLWRGGRRLAALQAMRKVATHCVAPPKGGRTALGETDVSELAFLDELSESFHLLLNRGIRINASWLEEIDLLNVSKSLLDVVDAAPQILGSKEDGS